MASNGGTLNGVPQQTQQRVITNNSCNTCGLTFDSSDSLQVHVHYHHSASESNNSVNRWTNQTTNSSGNSPQTINGGSLPATGSNSPTDSENNNHPKNHHISQQQKSTASPTNFTISAAADSSDNQPPTPQSTASAENLQIQSHHQQILLNHNGRNSQGFSASGTNNFNHFPQQQPPPHIEMHYPSYMTSYDQFYHQHSIEYGMPPPNHYLNNSLPPTQSQHSTVPSSNRFHPYGPIANSLPSHHPYVSHHHAPNQAPQSQSASAIAAAAIVSAAAAQSTMSPSVVTSSSPIQNNLMHSTTVPSTMASSLISSQPTPSPSPRQCDKCGFVCETITQLSEHQASAHNATETTINRSASNDIENDIPTFQYSNYGHGKDDQQHQQSQQQQQQQNPDCDILDLDSQKMVYPPHELSQQGPLPPMHSLHPMQRPPMMWPHGPPSHDPNNFLPIPPAPGHTNDIKSSMFGSIKNEFSPQIVKQESGNHLTQLPNTQSSQSQADLQKSFGSDGNQLTTSPSEFPSTTTPQDNGTQFRTFEPPTSSLPNGGPIIKASTWKSNEARRPKTYNCTACNKWFTSSGHLKRHYNTTLHKNAVKSRYLFHSFATIFTIIIYLYFILIKE